MLVKRGGKIMKKIGTSIYNWNFSSKVKMYYYHIMYQFFILTDYILLQKTVEVKKISEIFLRFIFFVINPVLLACIYHRLYRRKKI